MAELFRSRYTVAVDDDRADHDNTTLLYNAATGAFLAAGPDETACFASGGGDHPECVDVLMQGGFLTELSPGEELEAQRRIFAARRADPSTLKLAIAPSYACNCRCVYCYELDKIVSKQRMPQDAVEAIYRFVQARYDEAPFSTLHVEWYGGEPMLCFDLIREMAAHLIAWADERSVRYESEILSNSVLIDDEAACALAEARVGWALVTVDGPHDLHNARRPAVGCDDPFQAIMGAIEALQENGIRPAVAMNTDKVNAARYEELDSELFARFGIHVQPGKLNDYAHCYGSGAFASPDFELYTHPEFARQQYEWFAASNPTADDVRAMLKPVANFCSGQSDRYFVIDAMGDVYKCDGWMGDPAHRVFNLLDEGAAALTADATELHTVTFDPCENPKCSACELLPVCWGNCIWERELTGMPCHPFKTTLPDYLRLLAELQG